jgi:predicted Zn-dependent peptidase
VLKSLVLILIFLQGVLLSSQVHSVKVHDISVPMIFEKDSSLPLISMQVVFKNSGSIFDGDQQGVAKFAASMLGEGTKSDGAVGFAKLLEDSAIDLSFSSGGETFVCELSSIKEQFDIGVTLLNRLLKDPNFTTSSFDKVKLLKKSYLKQKETDFDYIASQNLKKLLYKDTPLGRSFIGTSSSLDKLSLKDVKEFFNSNINLSNIVVVIGGDLTISEAKSFVEKSLISLRKGSSRSLKSYKTSEDKESVKVYKDTKQAYIYFGAPYNISVKDPDSYKARVATFILGAGGFGSRLMEEIRVKRGLAYSAYASLSQNLSHSDIRGHLQTKIDSQDEAIELVKEVIKKFVRDGVTSNELDQAKKFLLGSEPLRRESLHQRLNRAFMIYYKGFDSNYYQDELKKIESLKIEELNSFIKSHKEIENISLSIVTKGD